VELEQKGHDADMLNNIFRSVHTIKGAAGFLGFQPVVNVAHAAENIMKKLREGEVSLSKPLMDVILKSVDMIRLLLAHIKNKDSVEEDTAPLVQELESALKSALSGGIPIDKAKSDTTVKEQVEKAEPANVQGLKTTVPGPETPQRPEEIIQPLKEAYVIKDEAYPAQEQAQAIKEPPTGSKDPSQPREASQAHKETPALRVDVQRIDKVMDLAGEVVLIRNRLLNLSSYFEEKYNSDTETENLAETVSFLDRVTSDMQIAVMKMRMRPIQKVFSKFPRLVRDMSSTLKKDVELQIFGEGTEVDKSVIEHIGDPMTHILRNSMDHGLETTEERLAKGKPEKGKIVINAYQKGNQIVIEVSDDGKGMDVEKLKRKAVEKSLITEEEALRMSDEAATNIIFLPGFSTKEVATELSGRGVGMDVVKTNISILNGYVEVITRKGEGTTFKICIPLTLAIMQALMVEVAGDKYAIPLSPIEETLRVSPGEINNVAGQAVIVIRERICPLFELDQALGVSSNGNSPSEYRYIVVIAMGDKRFCVAVDRLLGQEEVVIKNITGVDTTAAHVLGTTITGDGKVVFILDLASLSRNLLGAAKV
ncbi:MAG: chemotaxis protein CheA, partial [Nitrospirae bacterium]|nr:chemotaxis protein CheA [Nitrospirota bacterium]